jgi:serine/threonine-protein kinase
MLAQPGDLVGGRYRVVRPLGAGAVAEVYQAEDTREGGEVALKIMKRSLAAEPEMVERLAREARVQEMIAHPNVARLRGAGITERAEPYLVVELLRGRTLRHVLKAEGTVDRVRAASYAWQALQGLGALHLAGVCHRDLKPANLMLEPSPGPVERVVLIDFGFASIEGQRRLTQQGHVVGSLAYVAPERLLGAVGDPRADLYGIGVILFELLVGRRPFVADDEMALVTMQLDEPPPSPRALAPQAGISPALEHLILTALAKRPEDRFLGAADMASTLEAILADER